MSEAYRLKHLTGTRLRVFLAAADLIIPPDDSGPGAGTLATAGVADWALDRMPQGLRKKILLFLLVLNFLGLFFGGRFFVNLGKKAQTRELAWLESARLSLFRMGFFGLKNYVSMGYYTRAPVWESIGYAGPLLADAPFPDTDIRGLATETLEVTP